MIRELLTRQEAIIWELLHHEQAALPGVISPSALTATARILDIAEMDVITLNMRVLAKIKAAFHEEDVERAHWRCGHEPDQEDEDGRDDALYGAIRGYLIGEGMAGERAHRLALRTAQLVMTMAMEDGRRWRGGQAKVRDIASCRPSFLELLAALRWDWISRGTRRRCR